LKPSVVGIQPGEKLAVPGLQSVAPTHNCISDCVCCDDRPLAVQLNDSEKGVVEQVAQCGDHGLGIGNNLPNPHELTDVWQESRQHGELVTAPPLDGGFIGVRHHPRYGQTRPVHPHVQAALRLASNQQLVESERGLEFLLRIHGSDRNQTAVRKVVDPRDARVSRGGIFSKPSLKFLAALATIGELLEEEIRPFSHHQVVAPHAHRFIDQRSRGRPQAVVQHGLVKRRNDSVELFLSVRHQVTLKPYARPFYPSMDLYLSNGPLSTNHSVPNSDHADPGGRAGGGVRLITGQGPTDPLWTWLLNILR